VPVANPSPALQERLGLGSSLDTAAVTLRDRPDRQGITLHGSERDIRTVTEVLRSAFPRTVSREEPGPERHWSMEFPASVKQELDARRREILPTLLLHHQLKSVVSEPVDIAERELLHARERLDELSARLRADLIERHIRPGSRMSVEHVKPAGQTYDLKGVVASFDGRFLRVDRRFHPGGTYDSLDVPRLAGDYGRLDIEIGSGIAVRRYFRADGRHLGDLYNLATEAELYPGRVRYVDLELDVLHMPGEPPRVVDEADLERAYERGYLTAALVEDAWSLARQVMYSIEAQAG
jgi:probable ribonuclease FAU-1